MKRFLALCVSFIVMAVIFIKIDRTTFLQHFSSLNFFWTGVAFFLFIPQIMLTGWRWQWMIRHDRACTLGEAVSLVLATSSLNVFMPSKMGDLCKAYYLAKSGQLDWRRGLNQVLFERFLDLWALCWMGTAGVILAGFWTELGFIVIALTFGLSLVFLMILRLPIRGFVLPFAPKKIREKIESFFHDAHDYVERLKSGPAELGVLFASSLTLWALHVIQFYFMALAIGSSIDLIKIFIFIPIGILVGLLPFTVAGIGTRDAAFLYLFAPYETSSRIVFLGLFATVRYLVPGLVGIPFISRFFSPAQMQGVRNESVEPA